MNATDVGRKLWRKRMEHGMDSQNRIRNLYKDMIQRVDNTDEIYQKMKEELLGLLTEDKENMDKNEYEHYKDKIFRAASVAEESGFVRGFRYAFRLFLECMEE